MTSVCYAAGLIIAILTLHAVATPLAGQKVDSTAPVRVAVRAARLISPKDGKVVSPAVVLVENDRITAVGANLKVPAGAQVIDLGSVTLLPGLIDCHTHITGGDPGNYYESIFRKSPIDYAVRAHLYARRTLEAGFTSVRDVGAGEFVDIALRKAIAASA